MAVAIWPSPSFHIISVSSTNCPSSLVVTMNAIRDMNATTLLNWVQRRLRVPLSEKNTKKFLSAEITGNAFLQGAKDEAFFTKAGLAFGPSVDLSILAKTIVEPENGKGRIYLINTTQPASR